MLNYFTFVFSFLKKVIHYVVCSFSLLVCSSVTYSLNFYFSSYFQTYNFLWPPTFFLRFFFFLIWTIFKVFIEFVTILLLFYGLDFCCCCPWSQGMWDFRSPTRDWIGTSSLGRQCLNHQMVREASSAVPIITEN